MCKRHAILHIDSIICVKILLFYSLKSLNVQKASKCLAVNTERLGHKERYMSPFSVHAKEHGKNFLGGKLDDITVIVAQV